MTEYSPITEAEVDILWGGTLFSGLSRKTVERLVGGAMVRRYDQPTLLFTAGDPADGFYAVIEGEVKLFAVSPNGAESIVHSFYAGQTFAEAAIFNRRVFPVSAEAMAGSALVRVDANLFLKTVQNDPEVLFQMLACMAEHEAFLMAELQRLKDWSPARRLAAYLLTLAPDDAPEDKQVTVHLPLTKQQVAGRIGIAPESLSRALKRLGKIGLHVDGDWILIDSLPRFREFVSGQD